jgi:hypothetical protein
MVAQKAMPEYIFLTRQLQVFAKRVLMGETHEPSSAD